MIDSPGIFFPAFSGSETTFFLFLEYYLPENPMKTCNTSPFLCSNRNVLLLLPSQTAFVCSLEEFSFGGVFWGAGEATLFLVRGRDSRFLSQEEVEEDGDQNPRPP